MNIHRAPSVWVLSGETATVDRLVRGMEEVGRRGEVCGCERDPKRLVILLILPVVCYLLMAVEVWLVFWAIGNPIGVTEGLTIETFTRLASVASAAIPGNLGALEASNAAVVAALGLGGGGALALTRRIRALLWAAAGLAIYPRIKIGDARPPEAR